MIKNRAEFEVFLAELRAWIREVAIPREDEIAETNHVPNDLVAEMADKGFFGWSIPESHGGFGFTTVELVTAAMELSYAATAVRARVGTNTGIGSEALVVDGTEEQKRVYLPRLASGEFTGCFALTEKEAGSDVTTLTTTARRDGGHYVINGAKAFITNAPIAGLFTVFARTNPNEPGHRGISAFLMERGTPGLETGEPYTLMGQAGSPVSEITFTDCRVPAKNLLGGTEGTGFRSAMKTLNKQRLHLAALCTGPATRMLDEALAHSTARHQFDQPIGDFQLVKAMIADCRVEIAAARALILEAARKRDAGGDVTLDASMCKYFASEMCGRVADRAVQIFGGSGYVAEYSVIERLYRDVRLFRLYEGTSQIHQLNIAKLTKREFEARGTIGREL